VTMPPRLRIGIDFDNTIIAYDHVFCAVGKRCGLLDPEFFGGKQAVRNAIRLSPEGELGWQRLQGQVYGKGLADATVVAGFEDFLRRCGDERCVVLVVSHKTEFGHFDPDRINLRTTALDWMAAKGLFAGEHSISPANVYFESTRAEKVGRIAALGLTHFIDDLKEVLTDPGFPPQIERILLGEGTPDANAPYASCPTWQSIEELVFGPA
jgi:hypothetical protein